MKKIGLVSLSLSLLVVIFLFLTSCEAVSPPKIEYLGHKSVINSLDKSTVEFLFSAYNSNSFAIKDIECRYNLQINNRTISSQNRIQTRIDAKSSSHLVLPVNIDHLSLFETVAKLVQSYQNGNGTLQYNLSGAYIFKPLGLTVEMPFSVDGTLELPKLPQITIANIKFTSISLDKAILKIDLLLANNNNFTLPIKSINYDLVLNNTKVASSLLDKAITLGKKSQEKLSLSISFSPLVISGAVLESLRSKAINYSFSGNLNIGTLSLPFDNKGTMGH